MTKVSGSCGNLEQNITLQWNNTANVTNNFVLHFIKNETTKQYSFHHLELTLTEGSKNYFIRKYLSLSLYQYKLLFKIFICYEFFIINSLNLLIIFTF